MAQPHEPLTGERFEFQAPPEFMAKAKLAASTAGMSFGAYIRLALKERMRKDRREREDED